MIERAPEPILSLNMWHDAFVRVTWMLQMHGITQSYVRHALLMCVAPFFYVCAMTDSYVWHDSSIRLTWLIDVCDMTNKYV